jgi:cell division protease FtsH
MRLKLNLLVLLMCLSPTQMHGVKLHLGIVSVDWEEIKENPILTISIIAAIAATSYVTQEYWLPAIQDYMKKNDNTQTIIVVQANEKETKKDDSNPMAKLQDCRARIYQAGEVKTTLQDVAGCHNAKQDLQDILNFLKNPKEFHEIGAKVPKGVLMQGPPGTGKTLLAKALAGEAQCPFISISASEFIETFVGVGAARVRDLFAKAKQLAPCIVFIDEFDAIGKMRSSAPGGGSDEYAQTLAQLLTLMDGFDVVKNPIIVIAATNRADVLDSAVVRPGRFDRKVEVGLPYIQDRIDILKVHLKNVRCAQNIDVPLIARATPGFSGAELAQLINEAAILAVNRKSKIVEMCDIDMARDHITMGRETKGMSYNESYVKQTATHEAGHAIAMIHQAGLVDPLYKVSIAPRGKALGVTWSVPVGEFYGHSDDEFKAQIIMLLAGGVAEEEFGYGKYTGTSNDIMKAYQIAYSMVAHYGMSDELDYISYDKFEGRLPNDVATKVHEEAKKIIDDCRAKCKVLIALYKNEIEQLADLLMEKGTVSGYEVYQMFSLPVPDIDFTLS